MFFFPWLWYKEPVEREHGQTAGLGPFLSSALWAAATSRANTQPGSVVFKALILCMFLFLLISHGIREPT